MREAIAAFRAPAVDRLDEIGLHEWIERGGQRLGRVARCEQERHVEVGAEHGGFLQHAPRVGGQPIDAREQQPLQRRWDVRSLARRGACPGVAITSQHAATDQVADDLLHEQRVAAGTRRDEVRDVGDDVRRAGEQAGDERAGVVVGKRGEPDHGLFGAREQRRTGLGPEREQQHQRTGRQLIRDIAQ